MAGGELGVTIVAGSRLYGDVQDAIADPLVQHQLPGQVRGVTGARPDQCPGVAEIRSRVDGP